MVKPWCRLFFISNTTFVIISLQCVLRSLSRLPLVAKCTHVSEENAAKLMELIKTNFHHDIAHYTRHGQLSLENGVYDMEHRSAQELFLRSERRSKLMDELEAKRDEWPSILKGIKMVDSY